MQSYIKLAKLMEHAKVVCEVEARSYTDYVDNLHNCGVENGYTVAGSDFYTDNMHEFDDGEMTAVDNVEVYGVRYSNMLEDFYECEVTVFKRGNDYYIREEDEELTL
jgi:hypothetical protein